jgi:hypothetical protein
LNRGDCCGSRINNAKVYIGKTLCGVIRNPKQGQWLTVNCRAKGSFVKIIGAPRQYLHFCGIKVWGYGGVVTKPMGRAQVIKFYGTSAKQSTYWRDGRIRAYNPFKSPNRFVNRWGNGMTCTHTLNDVKGPWWMVNILHNPIVTRISILNRGDCCGKRIDGAKVFVGK